MALPGITPLWSFAPISLVVCLVLTVVSKYFFASCRPRSFPPGPPTLPFIGNLTQVPKVKAFLKYVEMTHIMLCNYNTNLIRFQGMKNEYGSIIGLKFASQNVVILNSYKHVRA
jgi:hypothetical protein